MKIWGRKGADRKIMGILCGSGASGASVWIRDMGNDPPAEEGP